MTSRLHAFLPLSLLLLAGCGSDSLYEKSYPIEAGNWAYDDSLSFAFNIEDTLLIYDLWLEVEHSSEYPYQNLYTRIHTRFPSGQELSESLSLELADDVGRWYGDCNKQACTLKIPIQQGAFFDQAGTYRITLEQFMRIDPVPGVREITFQIAETGQTRR